MDTYLDIARTVLRAARRPMSARSILDTAYEAGVVPPHLHGRTQHKTLQARLSEDILHHRDTSQFYRTEPGQFALTEFLDDPDIPGDWKVSFPARRRTRDLKRPHALAVRRSFAHRRLRATGVFEEVIGAAEAEKALTTMHPDDMAARGYCAVWTFTLVRKADRVLAYRVGRYRSDRDAFVNKRSIGFAGALAAGDVSLFSRDRLVVADCAITVLQHDLDLSLAVFDSRVARPPAIDCVMAMDAPEGALDVVVVLSWRCPDWFEPATRRLSLNDPDWVCPGRRVNNIDDFDPWSARVLALLAAADGRDHLDDADHHGADGGIPSQFDDIMVVTTDSIIKDMADTT